MRVRLLLAVLVMAVVSAVAAGCGAGTGTTAPSPGHTGPTPPPGFLLLGSWTTTITRADLTAAGITDPGSINENAGRFTWTFSPDGTWRQVQVSLDDVSILNPVYAGSYVVEGDHLTATTDFPEQYRDDGIRYRWVFTPGAGVQFAIENPPDPLLPIIMESHPWLPAGP